LAAELVLFHGRTKGVAGYYAPVDLMRTEDAAMKERKQAVALRSASDARAELAK
jgi:hypothetical protein